MNRGSGCVRGLIELAVYGILFMVVLIWAEPLSNILPSQNAAILILFGFVVARVLLPFLAMLRELERTTRQPDRPQTVTIPTEETPNQIVSAANSAMRRLILILILVIAIAFCFFLLTSSLVGFDFSQLLGG